MNGILHIGCPVWACEYWRGSLFTERAARKDWLAQYSSVFNCVEGNSTFYGLPKSETVQRWAESCSSKFRFALKTPRIVTHDLRLRNADSAMAEFVDILEILDSARKLGPTFVQLPPDFAPDEFPVLESFLKQLPTHLPWAVEVRHFGWYDSGDNEEKLDSLLIRLHMDKVIFDSRPLYSRPPADEVERTSQRRKPKTPIRRTVTGQHPFLRMVGLNNVAEIQPWIDEWAPVISGWLKQNLTPFVFAHAPDDRFAPEFGRLLYERIRDHHPALPPLTQWPGEKEAASRPIQRTLF